MHFNILFIMNNNIFYFSSNGFPSKKYPNLSLFSFEQANKLKGKKVFLFDLYTNRSDKIFINSYNKKKIIRLIYTKYNPIKIFKNIFFILKLYNKEKPYLSISSFLNMRNIIYSFFLPNKKIVIIHGTDSTTNNYFYKIIYNFFLIKVNKIFTVSFYTKKKLLNNYENNLIIKKKIRVVHNGFSSEKFLLKDKKILKKIPKSKKLILCVANLVKRKNILTLVEIFYIINKKYPKKFSLCIVGNGPEYKNIKKKILDYNLVNQVYIFSKIKDSEMAALYYKSIFFMLFSKYYKKEFEGFGIVFLEAMFNKCIVFCSKHGGIQEFVKNNYNGFLFDLKNKNFKEQVVCKVTKMLRSKKIQKKIKYNAHKTSKNFSWKKNIDSILKYSDAN